MVVVVAVTVAANAARENAASARVAETPRQSCPGGLLFQACGQLVAIKSVCLGFLTSSVFLSIIFTSMAPSPIHPSAVHLVLQYIAPPSQLTQPLPPYLLSRDLLQRHHFLQISFEDPQEYLCWPSATNQKSRAVDLLESVPPSSHDELATYPVQYTSDEEHIYAHVSLSSNSDDGVRLVFQWSDDGWKYHDASLMPFPQGSRSTVSPEPLHNDPSVSPPRPESIQITYSSESLTNEFNDLDDDDDYWNAYGSQDLEDPIFDRALARKDSAGGTEDAYWAQYASVHGEWF